MEKYTVHEAQSQSAIEAQFNELNGLKNKYDETPAGEEKDRLEKQFAELADEIEASGYKIGFQVTKGFYPIEKNKQHQARSDPGFLIYFVVLLYKQARRIYNEIVNK